MTKRQQIDVILHENAVDCANTYCVNMSKEDKQGIKDRWRTRLLKMREIDQKFCDESRFKIHE